MQIGARLEWSVGKGMEQSRKSKDSRLGGISLDSLVSSNFCTFVIYVIKYVSDSVCVVKTTQTSVEI